jgi:exodeoxyribonuclease I
MGQDRFAKANLFCVGKAGCVGVTFFFYDLETSGINPRSARVMQFAGQRTDADLNPIGEPYNILIKMTEDVLPEPEALLVTGITPQKTIDEGITEAQFAKLFYDEIVKSDTVFVGFNNIRFDDEFLRFLLWRNFYDPYEWHWKNGCSRWDILDASRMARALRPEGIKWPFGKDGKPTNRLEYLTSVNKLLHDEAHDALSDVKATIQFAKLLKQKQPKLYDYLIKNRDKKAVKELATGKHPFVYTSGKYPGEFEKTTVVSTLGMHPDGNGVLVYDLRHDPTPYLKMSPEELVESWKWKPPEQSQTDDLERLPVKSLQFNRCPTIAPMSVLDETSSKRLKIDNKAMETHLSKLHSYPAFYKKLLKALEVINQNRTKDQLALVVDELSVDSQLYNGFLSDQDRRNCQVLVESNPQQISQIGEKFKDKRLKTLLPLYKARNFPEHLDSSEHEAWEKYRYNLLCSGGDSSRLAVYASRLEMLQNQSELRDEQRFILDELKLWLQRIQP